MVRALLCRKTMENCRHPGEDTHVLPPRPVDESPAPRAHKPKPEGNRALTPNDTASLVAARIVAARASAGDGPTASRDLLRRNAHEAGWKAGGGGQVPVDPHDDGYRLVLCVRLAISRRARGAYAERLPLQQRLR